MSARPKPRCADAMTWLRQRLGRSALAPLTPQDKRALHAYLHYTADAAGTDAALLAIGHTLHACQRSVWPIFQAAIPWASDWHNEELDFARFVRVARARVEGDPDDHGDDCSCPDCNPYPGDVL